MAIFTDQIIAVDILIGALLLDDKDFAAQLSAAHTAGER
jgi:hypothetical protein